MEKPISIDRSEAFEIDFAMLMAIGFYNDRFIAGVVSRETYKKNVGAIISVRRKIRHQDWPNMSNLASMPDNDFEKKSIAMAPFLDDNVSIESYQKVMAEYHEKKK